MAEQTENPIHNLDEIPCREISDRAVLSKAPLVSGFILTYNHEDYIAEAIEGVLMQETDFPIELVIAEDCSTDDTLAIVMAYQKKYPDTIRVVTSDQNVGSIKNSLRATKACRGKYMAFCEGDDYWNDPLKLQKQVDLLEQNPDCSGCFTDCRVIEGSTQKRIAKTHIKNGNRYTLPDMIKNMPVGMCHWVLRKSVVENLPAWCSTLRLGRHSAILFLAAQNGDCLHLPEPTATFRIHPGGVFSGADGITKYEAAIHNLLIITSHLGSQYRRYLQERTAGMYLELSVAYLKARRASEAAHAFLHALVLYAKAMSFRRGFHRVASLIYRLCKKATRKCVTTAYLSLAVALTSKYIVAYWHRDGNKNLGDELSPVIIEHLSKKKVVHRNSIINIARVPVYFVIGSIVKNVRSSNAVIWGAGFIDSDNSIENVPQKVSAVRGPLTRKKLTARGIECPEVYGDPALLYPLFFTPEKSEQYELGVVAHYVDRDNVMLKRFSKINDVLIIDITGEINDVVANINKCRTIASSSLHGLIISDAYEIPSIWIKLSDKVVGDDFKFYDYLSSVGREDTVPVYPTSDTTVRDIISKKQEYTIEIDLRRLLDSCPFIDKRCNFEKVCK